MSEPQDARKSLCWDCKFGLCIQEIERQSIVHPGNPPDEDSGLFEDHNDDGMDLVEHNIDNHAVKTVCFWRTPIEPTFPSSNITQSPPILVAFIERCNRFEKK